jgi:RNA polymerase sigma factor (TIGR02999 family)
MIFSSEASHLTAAPLHSNAMFVAVYSKLKQLALSRLRKLPAGQTLHATVLVHEAFLKLSERGMKPGSAAWANPDHFIAAASEAMRRILIDHYRRSHSQKRGGEFTQIVADIASYSVPESKVDLVALDEILDHFEWIYPEKAQVVKLRFFMGMTVPEVAQTLGLSISTVERHWRFSRAWLAEKIEHFQE